MTASFLNVDLILESSSSLEGIAAEVATSAVVLFSGRMKKRGRHFLILEVGRDYRNPDATIRALCRVVEKLSASSRRSFARARSTFDIGFELGRNERASSFTLRCDTLQRIVRIGGTVGVTYYLRDTE